MGARLFSGGAVGEFVENPIFDGVFFSPEGAGGVTPTPLAQVCCIQGFQHFSEIVYPVFD
jgi:hypothetical protein